MAALEGPFRVNSYNPLLPQMRKDKPETLGHLPRGCTSDERLKQEGDLGLFPPRCGAEASIHFSNIITDIKANPI